MAKRKFLDKAADVLARIDYPGYTFQLSDNPRKPWLRVHCDEGTCNVTGEPMSWNGRKWLLSVHMTETEIVWTAFKAVLTALEHEARELFTVDGVAVADSHLSINEMVSFARAAQSDGRH